MKRKFRFAHCDLSRYSADEEKKEGQGLIRPLRERVLEDEIDLLILTSVSDQSAANLPELDEWIQEISRFKPNVRILLAGSAVAAMELPDSVHRLADYETVLVEELGLLIHDGNRLDPEEAAGSYLAWLSLNHLNFLLATTDPSLNGKPLSGKEGFDYPTTETLKALEEGWIMATADSGSIQLEHLQASSPQTKPASV